MGHKFKLFSLILFNLRLRGHFSPQLKESETFLAAPAWNASVVLDRCKVLHFGQGQKFLGQIIHNRFLMMVSLKPIVRTCAATCHLNFVEVSKQLNLELKYALEWILVFLSIGYWNYSGPIYVFVHKCNLLHFINGI